MAEVKLDEAAQKPAAAEKAKTSEKQADKVKFTYFVCLDKCYYNGKLYRPGDEMIAPAGEKVPEHFNKKD